MEGSSDGESGTNKEVLLSGHTPRSISTSAIAVQISPNKSHNSELCSIDWASSQGTACHTGPLQRWDGILVFQAIAGFSYKKATLLSTSAVKQKECSHENLAALLDKGKDTQVV